MNTKQLLKSLKQQRDFYRTAPSDPHGINTAAYVVYSGLVGAFEAATRKRRKAK